MLDKKLIIVVVGPTASGKSELAVRIAKKVDGEIISADSRQIYKGLDIGSGKVEGTWKKVVRKSDGRSKSGGAGQKVFLYKDVPHYLIDEASPRVQYSVARFQKRARAAVADILARGKTPIICGGTGHWVDAIVFEQTFPNVKADAKLRAKLAKLTTAQLFAKLQKLDPARASSVDAKNPRRLVRALEIVITTGKPVPNQVARVDQNPSAFPDVKIEWIGLNPKMEVLEKKIAKRLNERVQQGMLKEVKSLKKSGLSWKRLESFGLEYKFCALHLQGKISEKELNPLLFTAIRQYAKRQMTWWKRNKKIKWFQDNKKARL